MRRAQRSLLALTIVCLVRASGASGQQADFQSDPRLQTSISMRLKIVSLADFVGNLRKLTRVPCSVAPAIADRKITAIFHDRAAGEVLRAVQDALFLDWVKAGDGYRLILPKVVEQEEQTMLKAEDEARRGRLLHELTREAQAEDLPEKELRRRQREIYARIDLLRQGSSPTAQQEIADLQDQIRFMYEPYTSGVAKALADDLPGVIDKLLSGRFIFTSTFSLPSVPKLAPSFIDHRRAQEADAENALAMWRFNTETQMIEHKGFETKEGMGSRLWTVITLSTQTRIDEARRPSFLRGSRLGAKLLTLPS